MTKEFEEKDVIHATLEVKEINGLQLKMVEKVDLQNMQDYSSMGINILLNDNEIIEIPAAESSSYYPEAQKKYEETCELIERLAALKLLSISV